MVVSGFITYAVTLFYGLMVGLSLGILSCSSPAPISNASNELSASQDELKEEALLFDAYFSTLLSEKDETAYHTRCSTAPQNSPFCFVVKEKNRLEKIFRQSIKPKPTKNLNSPLRVRFVKKKIANWPDLRFANVSSIIKGLGTLSSSHMDTVRTYALKEKRCPNNAALAVASRYEDDLPDRVHYSEIAKLYEKAVQCPMDGPDTIEMLWTRTGLFHLAAGNSAEALKAFKKATETKAPFKARSLYWLYRTQLDTSDYKGAQSTFQELKEGYPFSFHTLIALTNRNEDPGKILEQQNYTERRRSNSNSEVNQLLTLVEILHRYGFQPTAAKLLDWALALTQIQSEPELLVYISDLKEEQGNNVSKISLLSEVLYANPNLISRTTMEKYFPKPFFPIFQSNSEGIDPFLLLAIARRESAFNPRALSSANARGLLQVTPQTLRTLQEHHDLFEPSSNVKAGARLFGDLLRRLNGQIHLALAAYNAGPKKINVWSARYPTEDAIQFIDLIPYKETREYVAAVLRNYYWYRKLNDSQRTFTPRQMLEYQDPDTLPTPSGQISVRPIQNVPE